MTPTPSEPSPAGLPTPDQSLDPTTPAGRGQRILDDYRAGSDVRDALDREIATWRSQKAIAGEHAAILAALAKDPDLDAALDVVLGHDPIQVQPLRDVQPLMPPPLIWRGMTEEGEPVPRDWTVDPVLLHGSIALLGGAGGIGKSSVTLALALAAAAADRADEEYGEACGLRVAPRPVLLLSYEDEAAILRERANRIAAAAEQKFWDQTNILQIIETSATLFAPPDERGRGRPQPTPAWERVWEAVRETQAGLLVIDPLTAAYAGDANADAAGARALLEATRREARETGCGVLFVCHATKNERRASIQRQLDGELAADYIDPGAIAGSAAFYDGARGVLYMERAPSREQIEKAQEAAKGNQSQIFYDARLVCLKSNYGRANWWLPLQESRGGEGWSGFRAQTAATTPLRGAAPLSEARW